MAVPHPLIFTLLLLTLFMIVQTKPYRPEHRVSALQYENGKSYKYSYQTSVLFNNIGAKRGTKTSRSTGLHLSLDFDVTPVLQDQESQLVRLKLNSATVLSASRENQEKPLGALLKYPVYFELTNNKVERMFVPDGDSTFCTNIKKGIISLFQVQNEPGEVSEIDVSGQCSVIYTIKSPTEILKVKRACQNLEIAGQFSNPNKILGVNVSSVPTLNYELENNIIKRVSGENKVTSHLEMRSSMNGGALVRQQLTLLGTNPSSTVSAADIDSAIPILEKEIGKSFILSLLPSESEIMQCTENCESPSKLVVKLKDDLAAVKMATVSSAKAFLKMLKSFRNAGKNTIAEVLTLPESYHIVPQLIDIATATQTSSGQKAMMDLLVFEESYGTEHPERYLLAAAYSSHPGEYLLSDLLAILKKPLNSDVLKESVLLASGAVLYTYSQADGQRKHKIVEEFKDLLIDGLAKCPDDTCRMMYLRALGNAGLPDTVSVIVDQAAHSNNSMLSSTALEALRRIPAQYITADTRSAISKIFHQNKRNYDSSVRVAALDVLLRTDLSIYEVQDLLYAISEKEQFEFASFIKTKILDRANHDHNLRHKVIAALKQTHINNYHVMATGGNSSCFTGFIARTHDFNGTYTILSENGNSGVMKRSGMTVQLIGDIEQPFMNIGIYGEGLDSMMGDESGNDDDKADESTDSGPEMAAGLSFSLLDVLLKQYEFFRGMSGLMSAVWNAPSELTSALQGNLLLQDHMQRVHLSNGLILNTEVTGVASIDLSGYVSISLWNRNCESLIKNSGALYIEGSMQVESNEVSAGIVFTGEGEAVIDFNSDVDFYNMPIKMCLQMKRPDFKFKQTVSKFERMKGLKKYSLRHSNTKSTSGESFFLNKHNSQQCRVLKAEE